jgi:uncharacterized membrane protein
MQIRRAPLSLVVALFAVAAFLLPMLVGIAYPEKAVAQSKVYHMDRYGSDIKVNTDGSLDIQETLTYVFSSGVFHRGTRIWDTGKLDNITNIKVAENRNGLFVDYRQGNFDPDDSTDGVTGTYGIDNSGTTERVRWIFGNTSNTTRTFRITYHVNGAVRVYPDRDEFDWYAVPPRWGASINNSRVSATFPTGSDTSNWKISSIPSDAEVSHQGNTIVWTSGNGLGAGFEVGAQLPKGILSAQKPAWQAAVDQQEAQSVADQQNQANYDQNVRPLVDFGMFLLGVLLLIGGILLLIMRWYKQGRDKPVKLVADYLTEPPSDLPPGLVGTLLDESADVRDVIATVVDMGKKGNLTINETKGTGLFAGKDFQYSQTGSKTTFAYEDMVLNALFKNGQTVSLSELKNQFYSNLSGIYDSMYKALVDLKYFPENPAAVRGRNQGMGCGIIVLGALVFGLWLAFGSSISYLILLPGLALGVVGLVAMFLARVMPRKTDFGSEEAEKWRAFQRYLQQIQRYTNVQEAADRFQKYLPYAVAMGVDQEFTRQFESVPSAMPTWYVPYGYVPFIPYGQGAGGGAGSMAGGGVQGGGGGFDPGGAMQGMSNSLAGAMQGLSDSFTSMVNSASSILTSQPSSSGGGGFGGGGGWGGGGGGFGGGGGGGGGGGAD